MTRHSTDNRNPLWVRLQRLHLQFDYDVYFLGHERTERVSRVGGWVRGKATAGELNWGTLYLDMRPTQDEGGATIVRVSDDEGHSH